jgi:hypothetical protein
MGARLKAGVSIGQARAADQHRAGARAGISDANRGKGLRVAAASPIPGNGAPVAAFMAVLMGIVTLVLRDRLRQRRRRAARARLGAAARIAVRLAIGAAAAA